MERINQFEFYELANRLRPLGALRGDVSAESALSPIMQAELAVTQLLVGKPISLGVSRGAANELMNHIKTMQNRFYSEEDSTGEKQFRWPEKDDPPIPGWMFSYYNRLVDKFETVFSAEMREAATYYVPRRGTFSTPALIDSADESFPEELRQHIPNKTKVDWQAAGRCLAFNLLSASGFHVARAGEGTMEVYYQLFAGRPEDTLKSWYEYRQALKTISTESPTPAPDAKILTELEQMKDDYRNPLMHPRVVLSETEARMLFANGESVIMAMASEIKAIHEGGGVQPLIAGFSAGAD